MESRNTNIDLCRFIAAIIIMTFHLFHIGYARGEYPFTNGWEFVDFFLIITGYYTTKHFDGVENENPIKIGIIYTLKKFITFVPYTTAVTTLMYMTTLMPELVSGNINIKGFIYGFLGDYLFDVFLITESYGYPAVVPLWYISCLFIVFPFLCWILQIRNRYFIMAVSFIYSIMYYGYFGVGDISQYPINFLRILGGVALGAFIYEFTYAFNEYLSRINRKVITAVEIVTFLATIILMYKNMGTFRFIIFCYVISLSIMFTGYSYTNKYIKGKLVVYLGKLSMPIFIIHWYIGTVINELTKYFLLNNEIKLVLYYGMTILVALVTLYTVEHWKWYQKIIHGEIKLRD